MLKANTKEERLRSYRCCCDFRYLNSQMEECRYIIIEITESFTTRVPRYLTSIDFSSGFFQMGISPESTSYSCFQHCFGTYKFLRLPMDLWTSPNTFQLLMDKVLHGLTCHSAFCNGHTSTNLLLRSWILIDTFSSVFFFTLQWAISTLSGHFQSWHWLQKLKNIDNKQSNKRNLQNSKSKRKDNHMEKKKHNDRTTWTSMKTRGEIRCSGRVIPCCFAYGTRHDVPCVVSRNETYSWQQHHDLQLSLAMVVIKLYQFYSTDNSATLVRNLSPSDKDLMNLPR